MSSKFGSYPAFIGRFQIVSVFQCFFQVEIINYLAYACICAVLPLTMLSDFFTSLTTSCSAYARGMGYLDESLAMRRRYRRRSSAWRQHLENTRRFVLSSAEKCRKRDRAVVMGSGLLLDVPIAELASLFREVVLADVVCLPEVRKRLKSFAKVSFIEKDVTDIAERLHKNKLRGIQDLPDVNVPAAGEYENRDLVVSLNILSQLWVVPRAYAVRPRPRVGQEQLDDWCGRIVASHYAFLRSLSCPVCLISDYEFVKRDREGEIISRGSTVYGLPLPKPDLSWIWDVGPLGEESSYYSKELHVGAWLLK